MYEIIIYKSFQRTGTKVVTDCKQLYIDILTYYSEYIVQDVEKYDVLRILKKDGLYMMHVGEKSFASYNPIDDIDTLLRTKEIYSGYFVMHAGGVVYNDSAVLFMAPSNSGKSTIVTYLLHQNMGYISDDSVVIDTTKYVTVPFYKPICLRNPSLDILKKHGVIPSVSPRGKGRKKRYMYYPTNHVDKSMTIRCIFIPQISNINGIELLPKNKSIQYLMMSSIKPYNPNYRSMIFFNRLSSIACYKLYFNNLDFVYNMIVKVNPK